MKAPFLAEVAYLHFFPKSYGTFSASSHTGNYYADASKIVDWNSPVGRVHGEYRSIVQDFSHSHRSSCSEPISILVKLSLIPISEEST